MKSGQLADLKAGVSLAERTGHEIEEIVRVVTRERMTLARQLGKSARRSLEASPPDLRSSISRAYYSMYHAFRATAFFITKGDDHEKHMDLPEHLPADFPSVAQWKNELKNARLLRNRADYDLHTGDKRQLLIDAEHVVDRARCVLPVVRAYLRRKGCDV